MRAKSDKGFTLIEIMLVILILAILMAFIGTNFYSAIQRGRDAKRKEDLRELQKALEAFYEDYGSYPSPTYIQFGSDFSAEGRVYFRDLPQDPKDECTYKYIQVNSQSYLLLSTLENKSDEGRNISQNGFSNQIPGVGTLNSESNPIDCSTAASGDECICRFYLASPDIRLEPSGP